MLDSRQVYSLTDFLRNQKEYVARLAESKSSVVLTVKSKASLVLPDAEGYQKLHDRLERAEERTGG